MNTQDQKVLIVPADGEASVTLETAEGVATVSASHTNGVVRINQTGIHHGGGSGNCTNWEPGIVVRTNFVAATDDSAGGGKSGGEAQQ